MSRMMELLAQKASVMAERAKERADSTAVVTAIRAARCDLSDEKRTQADIAEALTAAGIPFEREFRLAAGDIVDFLAYGAIAVEVKLKGAAKRSIFRQLKRYAEHDAVQAIVLVTNLSMGMPAEIAGKPAYYVSLGRAWL